MPTADRRTTLRDVARESGVSVSTASRCLSGRGGEYRISAETVGRVSRAAAKLNFRPNTAARSLRTRRSGLVGVVVPDVSNPFFAGLAGAVTPTADEAGKGVLLADSQFDFEREARLLKDLAGREVEGVVICSVADSDAHIRTGLGEATPVVLADREIPGSDFCAVRSDHEGGGRIAAEVLVEAGHRTVGYLQGEPNSQPSRLRLQGFRGRLAESGLDCPDELVAGGAFTAESGRAAAVELLDRRPDVTAFFAANVLIVIGALQHLAAAGRRVPEDLSLIAFDDHPLAEFLAAPLTCVAQDTTRLGREAGELLARRIAGEAPESCRRVVPVELRSRGSVARPREGGR